MVSDASLVVGGWSCGADGYFTEHLPGVGGDYVAAEMLGHFHGEGAFAGAGGASDDDEFIRHSFAATMGSDKSDMSDRSDMSDLSDGGWGCRSAGGGYFDFATSRAMLTMTSTALCIEGMGMNS